MNITIPYSWLKDYLKTSLGPEKISECLTLRGASVEKITKIKNDFLYEIETTTNRVDMLSVLGIAREAAAILPQFGFKAQLKNDPYKLANSYLLARRLKANSQNNKLKVIIKDKTLCPRFSAVVFDHITIKPSPKFIQERLLKIGLRPINNIVDITNYLLKDLGQPCHAFDWNQIKKQTMILRKSIPGESITTLDDKTRKLGREDIVIEDGSKRIIDLCGIMGGQVSQITDKTQAILFFVQNYNPYHIRQTMKRLGIRTDAGAIFEKSPDPELVSLTLLKAISMVEKYAGGRIAGKLIDIYPNPYTIKVVKLPLQLIKLYLGFSLQANKVIQILNLLGFKAKFNLRQADFTVHIPSWRAKDIALPEDLVEEIARIYGYENLPSCYPNSTTGFFGENITFKWENIIKDLLKSWGLTETYTYSLQSQEELENCHLNQNTHLKIKNPLSFDWVYLRRNLIPSLLSVLKKNRKQLSNQKIKIFELSNVYLKQKGNLPQEKLKLALVFKGTNFYSVKGIAEQMLTEMGISELKFITLKKLLAFWQEGKTAQIFSRSNKLGLLGEIKPNVLTNFSLKPKIFALYLDWETIINLATRNKKYHPLPKYPAFREDLSLVFEPNIYFAQVFSLIKNISPLINKISLIDSFKNSHTLRITYQDYQKNLTSTEVKLIRNKILNKLKTKGWAKLKEKESVPGISSDSPSGLD